MDSFFEVHIVARLDERLNQREKQNINTATHEAEKYSDEQLLSRVGSLG